MTTVRGHVGVARGIWSARISRDVLPTVDASIVVDDRLSGAIDVLGGKLSAFVALSSLYEYERWSIEWTGGVAATRGFDIAKHVTPLVTAEVARSYYAQLDDMPLVPQLGARLFAVLSVQTGTD